VLRNLGWLALAACGGVIEPGVDASIADATSDAVEASCGMPNGSDCKIGRTVVKWDNGGMVQFCVPPYCIVTDAAVSECTTTEYGAQCGGDPTTEPGNPPSSACRLVAGLPNGTAFFCCPCE